MINCAINGNNGNCNSCFTDDVFGEEDHINLSTNEDNTKCEINCDWDSNNKMDQSSSADDVIVDRCQDWGNDKSEILNKC